MSEKLDPIEVLARLRPADSMSGPIGPGDNSEADAVFARVLSGQAAIRVSRRRRRRRYLLTGLGVVGTALAGSALAWAVVRHAPADDALSVACYETADLESSLRVIASDGRPATELCKEARQAERLSGATHEALVACVGPGGAPAVFPGASGEVCTSLGLLELDPMPAADETAEISFQESLTDRIIDLGCISGDDLKSIVTDELQRAGLDTEWTVTSLEAVDDLVCAAPRLDAAEQTVFIEFLPDIWSSPSTTQEEP